MVDTDPDPTHEIAKFYNWAAPRLLGFLVAQGFPAVDAADAVQEAFLAALSRWSELTNPYGFLRRAAYRRACDICRRARRESLPGSDFLDEHTRSFGASLAADEQAFARIERDQFIRTMQDLFRGAPRQREIIVWTYDGAAPKEIAGALGCKPATVRSALRAAREKVRRLHEGARDEC